MYSLNLGFPHDSDQQRNEGKEKRKERGKGRLFLTTLRA